MDVEPTASEDIEGAGMSLEEVLDAGVDEFMEELGQQGEAESDANTDPDVDADAEAEEGEEVPADAEVEDETEGDEEADGEQSGEEEGDASSSGKGWRAEAREKITKELTPKIREELQQEFAHRESVFRKQIEESGKHVEEARTENLEAHLLVAQAKDELAIYQEALARVPGVNGRSMLEELGPRLELIEERHKVRRLQEQSVVEQERRKQAAEAEQREVRLRQDAHLRELKALARGAGVDPRKFLMELTFAHQDGEKVDPSKLLAKLKSASGGGRQGARKPPRTLRGGGNSGGAPRPEITLDSPDEDLLAEVEAFEAQQAQKRR